MTRLTPDRIAYELRIPLGAVRQELDELERDGQAEREIETNWWRLTEEGEQRFRAALEGIESDWRFCGGES